MVYLDTNVLIYASVHQGEIRRQQAIDLIESLVNKNQLVLSVLSLQELAYTLAKLKVPLSIINQDIDFYRQFVRKSIDIALFDAAYYLAVKSQKLTSLNDAVHLAYAQHYATKLITFDKDFAAFKPYTDLSIDIIT
jgi:predicted nucleic acid-binding protein